MSIVTKTGDRGTTGLMYNRRVSKNDPRLEACGSIDELTSALGLARANAPDEFMRQNLLAIQKDLVIVMGELATLPEDRERYFKDGFAPVTPELTRKLDDLVRHVEPSALKPGKDWVIPGDTPHSAALDNARSIARRAERRVCALQQTDSQQNPELLIYLNRLSDALWLLARWVEARQK